MEAPTRSGALITRFANEYGRDVYVLPGSLDNPRSLGCLDLVNNGAQVILSESHLEMWEQCHKSTPESPSIESSTPNLEPELKQVLAIALECVSFDLIVQQTGLAASAVSSALLQLEPWGWCPRYGYQRC